MKAQGRIEPYERRAAPWNSPHYAVWQRNQMWGSDWTKLSVGGVRWYLLAVIDFFSRLIVAWEVVPTVHAGTIKQEEIYLVGNYPDELLATEEIGRYIGSYHHSGPHQAPMNFTPAHVHQVNNKSRLWAELQEMKRKTRERRKAYWSESNKHGQTSAEGGCPDKGQSEIVNPGANTQALFQHQPTDSQIESPTTENFSLLEPILSH